MGTRINVAMGRTFFTMKGAEQVLDTVADRMGHISAFPRRLAAVTTALSLSILLGGCVSGPNPSAPLPVMARADSQAWAQHMHPDAIRKICALLEKEGFTIKGYRETWQDQPDALLYAANDKSRYFVDVSTGGGTDRLVFSASPS